MSTKIEGVNIYHTKGDTFLAQLTLTHKGSGDPYSPVAGDTIRFALKRKYTDEEPLIIKSIPTDTLLLELEPMETKELELGAYVYDVELTKYDGTVETFIPPDPEETAKFTLLKEVY